MKTVFLLASLAVGVWMIVAGGSGGTVGTGDAGRTTMQAAFYDDYGAPLDVMSVRSTAVPRVRAGDVLIKVRAAALNPVDYKIIGGSFKLISPWILAHPPKVPGFDVSGEVVAVGGSVSGFAVGDHVFAMADFRRCGTLAEYVAVEAELVVRKPAALSWEGAASLPLVATTGYKALVEIANVLPGQSVLILGASGGTGSFGVQLAKALGATVVATSGARNAERVRGLGADEVLDYRAVNWGVTLAHRGFDVVYDCIGGYRHWLDGSRVLKPGGHFVTIVGDMPGNGVGNLLAKGWAIASRHRWLSGVHYSLFTAFPSGPVLKAVAQLADDGKIVPTIDSTFPLSDAAAAMQRQREGHASGKIIVVPDAVLRHASSAGTSGQEAPAAVEVDAAAGVEEAVAIESEPELAEAEAEVEAEAEAEAEVEAEAQVEADAQVEAEVEAVRVRNVRKGKKGRRARRRKA